LVNDKTGTRHIPLFSSVPYIKDWLDSNSQRGNKNTYLVPTLIWRNRNLGNKMESDSLNGVYRRYKMEFFPSLFKDPKYQRKTRKKSTTFCESHLTRILESILLSQRKAGF
jgi:hypothetical protein